MSHNGNTQSKKYWNAKIARKSHGHTIVLDHDFWRDNFEDAFREADDSIHRVAQGCMRLFSLTKFVKLLGRAARSRISRRTGIEDFSEYVYIDANLRRDLVNLCLSLLIRSPGNRHRLERAGASFGLPANEEVGKMNMKIQVERMNEHYKDGFRGNVFPLIIYSHVTEFIYGDGLLDGISRSVGGTFLRGHALVPLTPHICVLLATPHNIKGNTNARTLFAPPWLVDEINSATQVYSKSVLFYASRSPTLTEDFKRNEHRCYKGHMTDTIKTLVDLCGERELRRFFV